MNEFSPRHAGLHFYSIHIPALFDVSVLQNACLIPALPWNVLCEKIFRLMYSCFASTSLRASKPSKASTTWQH